MKSFAGSLLIGASCLIALPARAALTDSEKAQIQGFIRSAEIGNARRVRALVARPDLSPEETAQPLVVGFAPVPFDDKHAAFAKELLIGPGSQAARSGIAPALVEALLGRASALVKALPASPDDGARSDKITSELLRIHGFVSDTIANAGHPPADGHDAGAGFRDDALKAAFAAYRKHFERSSRDFGQNPALRAQAALTMIDLGRGIIGRRELSSALGLAGARQTAFERHGTLIEECGKASEARLTTAVRWLDSAPSAASALGLFALCKAPIIGLKTRGAKASARVSLDAAASKSESSLWPAEVTPAEPDRELSEVAFALAWVVARDALKKSPELKKLAARVAERAERAGPAGYLAKDLLDGLLPAIGASGEKQGIHGVSPELFVAEALRLVWIDARRATHLALARKLDGRDEPAAALVLALSVLAVENSSAKELVGGRTLGDGKIEAIALSGVTTENGLVSGFTVDKEAIELSLGSDGAIQKARFNGADPKLGKLALARPIPKAAEAYQVGKQKFERLSGEPRGAVLDDGRLVLTAAEKTTGFDAVASGAASSDQAVHAWVKPSGRGGGLLVRGQAGEKSYDGIALIVSSAPSPKALLILVDGKARAVELAPAIDLPAPGPDGYALGLAVKGQAVTATIDDKKIEANLTRAAGTGRIGLVVAVSGSIEASEFGAGPAKAVKKSKKP